jgi:hypothetical protein
MPPGGKWSGANANQKKKYAKFPPQNFTRQTLSAAEKENPQSRHDLSDFLRPTTPFFSPR